MYLIDIIHFLAKIDASDLTAMQGITQYSQKTPMSDAVMEWASIGVASLLGAGAVGSIAYSAYNGVRTAKDIAGGLMLLAGKTAISKGVGALSEKPGLGKSNAQGMGSLATTMNSSFQRNGIIGYDGAGNAFKSGTLMSAADGTLLRTAAHAGKVGRETFEAVAKKTAAGGIFEAYDRFGKAAAWTRDNTGMFHHSSAPNSKHSSEDLGKSYFG